MAINDSSLRKDIDSYLSDCFILAIKGFSSENWSIRNSSLMLFSSLTKRSFGAQFHKSSDQHSIQTGVNILEFFSLAPPLLDYFRDELNYFIQNKGNYLILLTKFLKLEIYYYYFN